MTKALPPEGADKPDADQFGRGLAQGIGINLLITDMASSLEFQTQVLDAEVTYWDQDFAILTSLGSTWMLHNDGTYHSHPLAGIAKTAEGRGVGAELRLYGRDPDAAAMAAQEIGAIVLAEPSDKPHGLREAYILDPDGYLWVPSVPKNAS